MKALAYILGMAIAVLASNASELPSWSPRSSAEGCGGCGSGTGDLLDTATLLYVDMGPGAEISNLGGIALRASESSPNLGSPAALELNGFAFWGAVQTSEMDIRRDAFGRLRQLATARLFIDIATNSPYRFTIRVMDQAAKGTLANGFYSYSTNVSYLLKEYRVENPDASPVTYHRLKITETWPSTREWLCTYTATNSGWNVALPGSIGSVDLVTTNHAATAYTVIKRHRNLSGQIAAQRTQIYTNYAWGSALLSDFEGVGSEARTRRWTYYESGFAFTPTPFKPPLKTVENADGSWRMIQSYDGQGRVLSELHGISTGVTNVADQCRRITYSFTSQDPANDDGSRQPDSPRKIEEYWKETLVSRTYYVYTATSAKTVQCPNPTNALGNTDNVVSEVRYAAGTSLVERIIHADGTVTIPIIYPPWPDGTVLSYLDHGEPDGTGMMILNGTSTERTTRPSGAVESEIHWVLAGGAFGPMIHSVTNSDFDAFDRPRTVSFLNGLSETMTYACCGLESKTDVEGITTTFDYDEVGRQIMATRLGITQLTVFDPAGRVREQWRIGTNGNQIRLSAVGYTTAGLVAVETNALGAWTTYSRAKTSAGYDQVTSVFPDTGSQTNTYDGSGLLKVTGSAAFPTRHLRGLTTTTYNGASRTFQSVQEFKLDAAGNDTGEWVTTCQDGLGQTVKTIFADSAEAYVYYNNKGQKIREVDPDQVWQLYRYNAQGELEVTAIDVDHDGFVDNYDSSTSGKDRVTRTTTQYLATGAAGNSRGMPIRKSETTVWTTLSSTNTAKVQTLETSLDGLRSWSTVYKDQSTPVTSWTRTVPGTHRYVTNAMPNGSYSVSHYLTGQLESRTDYNTANGQVSRTSYTYDPHGRTWTSVDARNGATTYVYNNADQIASVTTPAPGTGQAAQITVTEYNTSLRPWRVTHPDGSAVTQEYHLTGLLKKTQGSRTYPVEYAYDPQGRMKTMKTWQNYGAGTGIATTSWGYSLSRGWLTTNLYQGEAIGTEYTYTPGGRLKTRKWARTGTGGQRVLTTYAYGFEADGITDNDHGDILSTTYSYDPSATQPVTYAYDRRGRRSTTTFNGMTTTLTLNDADLTAAEAFSGGTLSGRTVTLGFDNYLRRNSVSANTPTAISHTFGYDNASRLGSVTSGTYNSTYAYESNSRLIQSIVHKQNTTPRLTEVREYDWLNRLSSIRGTPGTAGQLAVSSGYRYNDANQRVQSMTADGSSWVYGYDALGQVTSGKRYWPDGTPVAGQQFEYDFDDIGNRTQTRAGGDQNGANLQTNVYTPNLLNQYTQRTVPGAISVVGAAHAAATVTVNSQSTYRRGEYYWKDLSVANGSVPVWQGITNQASTTTITGNVFVAKSPQPFGHDLDGNVTSDGRWTYTWDAENRLIRLVASTAVGPQQRIDFEYDAQGRRIRKKVWNNTAGSGSPAVDLKFLYDGWNLLAELNALSTDAVVRSYVWGLDLSGTMAGAGGVGGLLAVKNSSGVCHFVAYDGNGNVQMLVDGSSGTRSANYEYGPFGETIRLSGTTMATNNPVRFSTKYQDDQTDLLYYGFRFYNPSTGRWISRDSIRERGGKNLYGIVVNDPGNCVDNLGREPIRLNWAFSSTDVDVHANSTGVCEGQGIEIVFEFDNNYADTSELYLENGAEFSCDGVLVGISEFDGSDIPQPDGSARISRRWKVTCRTKTPVCPSSEQAGSTVLGIRGQQDPGGPLLDVATIQVDWSYKCNSCCVLEKVVQLRASPTGPAVKLPTNEL